MNEWVIDPKKLLLSDKIGVKALVVVVGRDKVQGEIKRGGKRLALNKYNTKKSRKIKGALGW